MSDKQTVDIEMIVAEMRSFGIDHKPEGWPAVQMKEIILLCDAVESVVPGLDRLEERLEQGASISKQEGKWHLFDQEGEGIVSGSSIRDLIINLVFLDC